MRGVLLAEMERLVREEDDRGVLQFSVMGEAGNAGAEALLGPTRRIETVAGWYRDPARANHFAIGDSTRDDAAWVLTGTARSGDAFSVRLTAAGGGGTDGTVQITPAR